MTSAPQSILSDRQRPEISLGADRFGRPLIEIIEAPGGYRIEPTPEGVRITHASDPGKVLSTALCLEHAQRIIRDCFALDCLEIPTRTIEL